MIKNPILRGFNPDPSIIRVEDDYYIATSTFEWFPGIRLYHSKNLKDWKLIGYPLNSIEQLDLRGVGISQGIWAPCLTYDNGTFYIVYTVVKAFYCNMYDTENYFITAKNINGPWSEAIPLNNNGFDPSMVHDGDKKYIVSMETDHRVPKKKKGRIVLQEYDCTSKKMVGEAKDIYVSESIFLEGPHIFKRGEYYYLFCADTGTGEGHGQSILRSREIWGPYEMREKKPLGWEENDAFSIITARHNEGLLLQKSGHCDLVETKNHEWYMVHLCSRATDKFNPMDARKFPGQRRYMIGRETAIQRVVWTEDGWLEMEDNSWPKETVEEPISAASETIEPFIRDEFDDDVLNMEYQSLRIPMTDRYISLSARPGWLRMYGRSGLSSFFSQSLIGRRMPSYNFEASTYLDYHPTSFKQMAGLIFIYDTQNYFYLHVTDDEDVGRCITLLKYENKVAEYISPYIPLAHEREIELRLVVDGTYVSFYYREKGDEKYICIGSNLDASFLSDEACAEGWFTGAMVGICTQDLTGSGLYADFDYFELKDYSDDRK